MFNLLKKAVLFSLVDSMKRIFQPCAARLKKLGLAMCELKNVGNGEALKWRSNEKMRMAFGIFAVASIERAEGSSLFIR